MALHQDSEDLVRLKGPALELDGTNLTQTYLTTNSGTVVMRIFDEHQEQVVARPQTRARAEVATGATALYIPHIIPPLFETADVVEIWMDGPLGGRGWFERSVTLVQNTGPATESTNFDELTLGAAMLDPIEEGAPIRLVTKDALGTYLPLDVKVEAWEGRGVETELRNAAGIQTTTGVGAAAIDTVATEDGESAANQDVYTVSFHTGGIGFDSQPGDRIRCKLQADSTMTEYGADETWTDTDPTSAGGGFYDYVPDILAGVVAGRMITVETVLDAGNVANVKQVKSSSETVVE